MIGLDTNVVVRYLTQDDPLQCRAVNELFERAARKEEPMFRINAIVIAEVVWVLDSVYEYSRGDIAHALTLLLTVRQLEVEVRQTVKAALDAYAAGGADFADYMIGMLNRAAGCETTLTFDKRAAVVSGFAQVPIKR